MIDAFLVIAHMV